MPVIIITAFGTLKSISLKGLLFAYNIITKYEIVTNYESLQYINCIIFAKKLFMLSGNFTFNYYFQ